MSDIKYNHYFKDCPYDKVDVYRVLDIFNVTDPCLAHAIKKLLVAGGRGEKSIEKDIQEAIDSLNRWAEMREEEIKLTPILDKNKDILSDLISKRNGREQRQHYCK